MGTATLLPSNPSAWWDDRVSHQRSSDFRHNAHKEPLCVDTHQHKLPWLLGDSGLPIIHPHGHRNNSPPPRQQQQKEEEEEGGQCTSDDELLQSLCIQGHLDMALDVLSRMHSSPPSTTTYLSLLKACIKRKTLTHAKHVHAYITLHKADLTGLLGDYLVMTLARCGALEDARHISDSLPHLTVFSWTAIISAYAERGCGQEALELYQLMQEEGVEPDRYTFVGLFKACGSIPDLTQGKKLHTKACMKGFTFDVFVSNSLVSMYGKCGDIVEAEDVFHSMSQRDIVSWNAMISAYVEQDQGEEALQLYRQMQQEGLDPNQQTFVIALKACGIVAEKEEALLVEGRSTKVIALSIGQALHADACAKEFTLDIYVGTALASMYAKCGTIVQIESMFSTLSQRNVISWNAMLSAYVEQGQGEKALQLYRQMQEEGVSLDELTVVFALQACGILAEKEEALHAMIKSTSLQIGQALHADVCTKDFASDVFVGTALLGMYSKCGTIVDGEDVFSELSKRNIVSWAAMLAAYIEQGQGDKALQLYRQMQEENMNMNAQTFVLALQACGTLAEKEEVCPGKESSTKVMSLEIGQALHADAYSNGYASDVLVGTALVSMYGKCGTIVKAENVFSALIQRDVVTWTAMLSAYVEEGHGEKALHLYKEMQSQHVTLDDVTLMCILQACGETGSLEICEQLHFDIVAAGYDGIPSVIATLIHAYGGCASMVDGQATFDGLPEPHVVLWTACISGHAEEGNFAASLHMLEKLNLAGLRPDEVTFSSVLSACSHSGCVVKALKYFDSMSRDYGIMPDLKHYGIMVDLFGRIGDFRGIENMLGRMPMEADVSIWMCLLGACCTHGNSRLAKEAFDHALNLQPKQATAYVLMSNAYADFVLQ